MVIHHVSLLFNLYSSCAIFFIYFFFIVYFLGGDMRHQLQYDNDMKEITVDICLTQKLITETKKKHAFKSNAQ